jgi:hypothetical protein
MNFSAGPTNVAAGDPITIKVQLTGHGQLDALKLPEPASWREFKVYPPTAKVEPRDQLGIEGMKAFEQVVVPQNSDIKQLPPFTFSFFDPEKKAYQTLSQPAVALLVRPGGAAAAPTIVAASRNEAAPSQDIVHIKQRLGTVAQIAPPLVERPWFIMLQLVPVLAWVSALIWRRRADTLTNNPRMRRKRAVAQTVRQGLDQLRQFAAAKKSDEFFATLFRLLQEQLGERLDLPASAITEAVIEDHLRPRRAGQEVMNGVQELFRLCDFARFAPVKSSQELEAIIPRFEQVLGQLQELNV